MSATVTKAGLYRATGPGLGPTVSRTAVYRVSGPLGPTVISKAAVYRIAGPREPVLASKLGLYLIAGPSVMVDGGINVFVIKEWMGHKCIETTLRYAHVKPQILRMHSFGWGSTRL